MNVRVSFKWRRRAHHPEACLDGWYRSRSSGSGVQLHKKFEANITFLCFPLTKDDTYICTQFKLWIETNSRLPFHPQVCVLSQCVFRLLSRKLPIKHFQNTNAIMAFLCVKLVIISSTEGSGAYP